MLHFSIKKITFSILIICSYYSLPAQNDSLPRHHISVNLSAATISGEVGFYYDYRLSRNIGFQLSYGHRFYSFNMIINGGGGFDIKYFPQQGDIVRLGVKKYFTFKSDVEVPPAYMLCRLSFWSLHTPTYTTRYGSNGLNSTPREVISVDKNVGNLGVGIGKEVHFSKHGFLDLYVSIGVSVGEKKIHQHYHGHSNEYEFKYPDNTFQKTLALFPTIETGCKIGLWR
jgi:hypothetical protein